jgi:hypothetical protein
MTTARAVFLALIPLHGKINGQPLSKQAALSQANPPDFH